MIHKGQLSLETLEDRFSSLPKDIQDAVVSADVVHKIDAIGKKRGLHIDQAGILAEETALVMLGETAPRDFPAKICSSVDIPEETARGIVEDLNREIFAPIRSSLTSIHAEEKVNALPTKEEILRHIENTNYESDTNIRMGKEEKLGSTNYEKRIMSTQGVPLVQKPLVPVATSPSSVLPTSPMQPAAPEPVPLVKKVMPPIQNLMEQKLSQTFTAPAKQTVNGGNGTSAPQPPAQAKIDPYREKPE